MSEDAFLAVLDDPLLFDLMREPGLVERIDDKGEAIAEDVDIDIGAVPDVARPDAADQARTEPGELAHQAERLDPHLAEPDESALALVHPGHGLDLVADLRIRRQIRRPKSILDPELFGRLALGGEVFRLGPLVHQLRGKKGDLPPNSLVSHEEKVRRFSAHQAAPGGPPALQRVEGKEVR